MVDAEDSVFDVELLNRKVSWWHFLTLLLMWEGRRRRRRRLCWRNWREVMVEFAVAVIVDAAAAVVAADVATAVVVAIAWYIDATVGWDGFWLNFPGRRRCRLRCQLRFQRISVDSRRPTPSSTRRTCWSNGVQNFRSLIFGVVKFDGRDNSFVASLNLMVAMVHSSRLQRCVSLAQKHREQIRWCDVKSRV